MRCKNCKVLFKPVYFLQKTCGKACEKEYKIQVKKEPKIKVISDKEKLQALINQLIRTIDKGTACISSGKFTTLQAGHYYSIGAHPELRFNLCNIYGQSEEDNIWKTSNRTGYEQGLIKQYGQEWADYVFGLPLAVKSGSIYTEPFPSIFCNNALSKGDRIYRNGSVSTNSQNIKLHDYKSYIIECQTIIKNYDSTKINPPTERIRQRLEFNHRIFGYSIPEGFRI